MNINEKVNVFISRLGPDLSNSSADAIKKDLLNFIESVVEAERTRIKGKLDEIIGYNGYAELCVRNICYTVFDIAKNPNTEDGGLSDWFNDTLPHVDRLGQKLRERIENIVDNKE